MTQAESRVRDVMTRHVKTLAPDDTLDLADDLMAQERIRHLPVLDNGQLVGIISERDLLQQGLAAALGYGSLGLRKILHVITVKEVMHRPVLTVSPEATVTEAGRRLLEAEISCLPVVQNGQLAGIVTGSDLLRVLIDARRGVSAR
jgi:acetoin utilization protein AcuB